MNYEWKQRNKCSESETFICYTLHNYTCWTRSVINYNENGKHFDTHTQWKCTNYEFLVHRSP